MKTHIVIFLPPLEANPQMPNDFAAYARFLRMDMPTMNRLFLSCPHFTEALHRIGWFEHNLLHIALFFYPKGHLQIAKGRIKHLKPLNHSADDVAKSISMLWLRQQRPQQVPLKERPNTTFLFWHEKQVIKAYTQQANQMRILLDAEQKAKLKAEDKTKHTANQLPNLP